MVKDCKSRRRFAYRTFDDTKQPEFTVALQRYTVLYSNYSLFLPFFSLTLAFALLFHNTPVLRKCRDSLLISTSLLVDSVQSDRIVIAGISIILSMQFIFL